MLPEVLLRDNIAKIKNVRNFRHRTVEKMASDYYDLELDVAKITTADLFISHFQSEESPLAHTVLSFGTADREQFLAVSVEARREVGEEFNFKNGVSNQFELIYVLADERDVIDQRAVVRGEAVFRYPLRITRQEAQSLLLALFDDVNRIHEQPEFYNILNNNCTSNLLKHAGEAVPLPLAKTMIEALPGYSDVFLRQVGLIDSSQPLATQREKARINELAIRFRDAADYSKCLRRE